MTPHRASRRGAPARRSRTLKYSSPWRRAETHGGAALTESCHGPCCAMEVGDIHAHVVG